MTDTTDKYHAQILAAIMVTSVMVASVASAGAAAGASSGVTIDDADSIYQSGQTISFTVTDDGVGSNQHFVWIDSDDDNVFDVGEPTVTVSAGGDSGTITIPSSLSAGSYDLDAREAASLSGGEAPQPSAAFTVDNTAPTVASVNKVGNVVEVTFTNNEIIEQDDGTALTAANFTAYVDGAEVSISSFAQDGDGGQITFNVLSDVLPNEELIVNINTVED